MMSSQQKLPSNDTLEIKSVTWSKISHGLFDYESSTFMIKKFHIQNTHFIYRKDHEIIIEEKMLEPQANSTFLTKIVLNDEKTDFEVLQRDAANPAEGKNLLEEVYIIVRSLKNKAGQQKGYQIETGDIIKLGRVEYLVLECKDSSNQENDNSHIFNTFCEEWQYKYIINQQQEQHLKKTCRICLSDDESLDDSGLFFISPCECKGSCKYVHFACLQSWINSKLIKKEQGTTTNYLWKKYECEVCEKQYPKQIIYGDKRHDLIHIDFPQGPYLLLENISRDKKKSKGLTIIRRSKDQKEEDIKLGRGHQCNLRITDISVSRLHALIKFENEKFLLFDNNSKFGTLVLLKNSMRLNDEKIAVQIGRTVISFSLKNLATMKNLIEKKNIEFLSAEKDKSELDKSKPEGKDNKEINEMFFKKPEEEEELNKSDELEKENHDEDQDL